MNKKQILNDLKGVDPNKEVSVTLGCFNFPYDPIKQRGIRTVKWLRRVARARTMTHNGSEIFIDDWSFINEGT